jgi:hypothetical protein
MYMPKVQKTLKEKRRHERYTIKLYAQLEVSLTSSYIGKIMRGAHNIIAMVETCNISIGGMLLCIVGSPMDAKKSLTRANASHLIGKPIEVVFCNEDITAWGDVVRADANTLEIAILINKVSDVQQWKKLCSENNDSARIFPDNL